MPSAVGKPLQIGPVPLATNLLLAPIAGYCDLAFRTICREAGFLGGCSGGVGLACTDLLSPQGLLRGSATSLDLAKTDDTDKPVGMQLYGSDPDIMAEGARWAVEHGATVVDINMGCPVDKVTKKDGGSKLLTDLSRAVTIAERVRQQLDKCPLSADEWSRRLSPVPANSALSTQHSALSSSPVPLTCKLRLCWSTDDYHAGLACSPHLAVALADVGVAAITIHGRTTEMKFSGECQRPGIARVVESINRHFKTTPAIPVIGNGDVTLPGHAVSMIEETGCRGVMIGRGALSTPWLFRDAWSLQTTGLVPPPPTDEEKIAIIRRFFTLMQQQRDDRYALFQIRRRISWFGKKLNGGHCKPFKVAIREAPDAATVFRSLDEYLAGGLRSWGDEPAEQEVTA